MIVYCMLAELVELNYGEVWNFYAFICNGA